RRSDSASPDFPHHPAGRRSLGLAAMATTTQETEPSSEPFDPAALQRLLDGRYAEVRDAVREVLSRPEFAPVIGLSKEEYREKVLEWAKTLAAEGHSAPGFPPEYGGRGDFGANVA